MDLNPHSSPDAPEPSDPLAQRLRDEARTNRPQFSAQLHGRILHHIHDQLDSQDTQHKLPTRQLVRYAAAIAIVAVIFAVSWKARTHRSSVPTPPNVVVKKDASPRTSPVTKPIPRALEFQIAGVVSADLLPPHLEFQPPSISLSASPRSDAAPTVADAAPSGLPERLLSSLRNPAVTAGDSLKDLIPPNFRLLLPLAQPVVDRARSDSLN